jgi:hypothetical protein
MKPNEPLLLKDEVFRILGAPWKCSTDWVTGCTRNRMRTRWSSSLNCAAFNAVVVDAKVSEAITDHERGQMLNYLRITGHKVGVILNFKRAKLEWERIVLDRARDGTKQPRMDANEREFRM